MNQTKIWSYFQNEAPEVLNKAQGRLNYLARQVARKAKANAKVLNVGVGSGYFEQTALRLGLDVFSLDPDEQSITRLKNQLKMNEKAQVGFVQSIPFSPEQFDVVVVSEVLEHLSVEILQVAFAEIHRVLRPGGLIMGTVPASEDLNEQLVVCPHCGERFHRWGHMQSFSRTKMRDLLSPRFQVQEIFEKYLDDWWHLNWKGKALSSIKRSLLRLGVKGSNNTLCFSALKRAT